jgi:hypothetical protein
MFYISEISVDATPTIDHSVHKEYVSKLIAGKADHIPSNGKVKEVYKLTNDTRITRVGKFLCRKILMRTPRAVIGST